MRDRREEILFEGKRCGQIFKRELSQNESQVPQLRKEISLVEKKKEKKRWVDACVWLKKRKKKGKKSKEKGICMNKCIIALSTKKKEKALMQEDFFINDVV